MIIHFERFILRPNGRIFIICLFKLHSEGPKGVELELLRQRPSARARLCDGGVLLDLLLFSLARALYMQLSFYAQTAREIDAKLLRF